MSKNLIDIDFESNIHEEVKIPNTITIGNQREKKILDDFLKNINILEEKLEIFETIKLLNADIADFILRGIIALTFSSLDRFLREILKYNLIQILKGEKSPTTKFKDIKLNLSLGILLESINKDLEEWTGLIIDEINSKNHKSILNPTKSLSSSYAIKNTLNLISKDKIFEEITKEMGYTITTIDNKMKEFYNRRNSILHQMDDNEKLKTETPISKEKAKEVVDFYKTFIEKIYIKIINS